MVDRSVGWLVGLFVCHKFLKGREATLSCSYASLLFTFQLFRSVDVEVEAVLALVLGQVAEQGAQVSQPALCHVPVWWEEEWKV